MVITSENRPRKFWHYGSTYMRYAVIYVLITFAVLLFLNIYCSKTSQEIFYKSKEMSMVERCQLASSVFADLQALNSETIKNAVAQMGSLKVTRMIVTDAAYTTLFDTGSSGVKYNIFPEMLHALNGNDVFTWNYHAGVMRSCAATPIYIRGILCGCVYMTEYDAQQGMLIHSLQRNILWITIVLELVVVAFSLIFANSLSGRIRQIRNSMRTIRSGDYSHRLDLGGNDELTLLANEFNALTERLELSEGQRRQFVSDASHELKTPLASIKLLTDSILQNEMDLATVREFVGDIGNEAERLNRMSQKLLELSKADSGQNEEMEILYIEPTIRRAQRMLSQFAKAGGIAITVDIQQDTTILISEDDLYQIVFNLAENGIKYNLPGGTLTITLEQDGDDAVLSVSDSGVGIPSESLPRIFERFYRVDKARSRKSGGSGLGLAIVKNLVERNGGTIHVSSQPGEGSTFRVVFPIFDTEDTEL